MKVLKTLAVLSMVFTLAACKTAPEAEKKAEDTPVVPADFVAAFQNAIKGKLVNITTANSKVALTLDADGKEITFDPDNTVANNDVKLTFVSAKSATEATYSDGDATDPKEAVVTLEGKGGKFVYDKGAAIEFAFLADKDFTDKVAGKIFEDDATTDKSTLIQSDNGKILTYDPDSTADNDEVTFNFKSIASANEATYVNDADETKKATVTIAVAGDKLTLVYDAKTITYTIATP